MSIFRFSDTPQTGVTITRKRGRRPLELGASFDERQPARLAPRLAAKREQRPRIPSLRPCEGTAVGNRGNWHSRHSTWRFTRATASAAASVIGYLVVAGALTFGASAAPFAPQSPSEIVERLPARSGAQWDEIAAMRTALAAEPANATTAAQLAARYLDVYRVEGDPRLVGFAEAALEPWREIADAPRDVALQLAATAQTQHRFDEALSRLDALLARDPRAAEGWLMRASIAQVLGRYTEARQSCARLVVLADGLTAGTCLASVEAVTGRADDASAFLASALQQLDDGTAEAVTTTMTVWVATLAAETAVARDRASDADGYFRAAFAATHAAKQAPSIYLIAAYSDFLIANDRASDALMLLASAPRNDSTLLRMAAAKKRLGQSTDAERADLEYRLQLTLAGKSPEHGREAAYFLARVSDEPRQALAQAAASFAVQREPLDAELLLEAAAGSCATDATAAATATPALEWLEANRIEHARLRALADRVGSCS